MIKAIRLFVICIFISLTSISTSSMAYEKGDVILRLGAASVEPDDSSTPLTLAGTEFSQLGLGLPVTTLQVDDNTQLGIGFTYMFNSDWGLEVLGATPFSHEIRAEALGVIAGETDQLPPTFSLQYYPMDAGSKVQPYVGVGINYTIFMDEKTDAQLNATLATLGATADATLALENSSGLAFEAGVDYKLNDHWLLNGAVWLIDIESSADINTPGVGLIESDVTIAPMVLMLSVGYLF